MNGSSDSYNIDYHGINFIYDWVVFGVFLPQCCFKASIVVIYEFYEL